MTDHEKRIAALESSSVKQIDDMSDIKGSIKEINAKLDLLIGKKLRVVLSDREENEFFGEMLGHDEKGTLLATLDRGREFIYYLPFSSIDFIEHQNKEEKEE